MFRTEDGGPDRTVVIVGNGMVSHRLCERLTERERDALPMRLLVIGEESRPAYDRVNLTRILFGEPPEALELADRSWYEARGIELVTGERVCAIDPADRTLHTSSGREIAFDELVLATGSRPFIPPIEGVRSPGVFEYRDATDLAAIRAAALEARRAVVLGGGLLGLEAARSLADLGLAITVVETAPRLLGHQLGDESAEVLLEKFVASGIDVRLGVSAQCIECVQTLDGDEDTALTVVLADGSRVDTDFVLVATGIRPRDELAKAAGLACGKWGGVLVDESLQTSVEGIYAIGECAAYGERALGFVAPGYAMADVLAQRLKGQAQARYQPALPTCELKGAGVEVHTVGHRPDDAQVELHRDEAGIRVLAVKGGRVVGAASVGSWSGLGSAKEAIASRSKVSERALKKFRAHGELPGYLRLPVASWPAERLVCNCMRVTRGQLTEALGQGALCPAALMESTGAGALCGSCEPLLDELCGGRGTPANRSRWILISSMSALVVASVVVGLRPYRFSTSVLSAWQQLEVLWRLSWVKQTTGFGLLGLCLFAASISLRKRVKWVSFGRFSTHRAFHTGVGTLAVLLTVAHTGMNMGHNLNFALMSLFVFLSVLGAATGIVAYLEGGRGRGASQARWWRPWVARAHWVATWPMAVLLGFHVLTAYYF